jgi:hypothetical protein
MRAATIPLLAAAALCVSCSESNAPPQPTAAQTPPPAQQTVIDDQLKALEKAEAVQGTVDQQKKDTDKKIDDAGG